MSVVTLVQSQIDATRAAIISVSPYDVAMQVELVAAPFVPSASLDLSTLTLASFTGSAAKTSGTAFSIIFDSTTGKNYIYIPEPAGGWKWTCSVAPMAPETIYGVLIDDVGCFLIPTTTITNIGDTVLVGDILVELPAY